MEDTTLNAIFSNTAEVTIAKSSIASYAGVLAECSKKKQRILSLVPDAQLNSIYQYLTVVYPQFREYCVQLPSVSQLYSNSVRYTQLLLAALYTAQKKASIILVPYSSMHIWVPSSDVIASHCFLLNTGAFIKKNVLLEKLVALGYVHADYTNNAGEFSHRGDIVDFYPAHCVESIKAGMYAHMAVRMEFFGDEVETIRIINPDTQRTVKTIDSIEIVPLSMEALYTGARTNVERVQQYALPLSCYMQDVKTLLECCKPDVVYMYDTQLYIEWCNTTAVEERYVAVLNEKIKASVDEHGAVLTIQHADVFAEHAVFDAQLQQFPRRLFATLYRGKDALCMHETLYHSFRDIVLHMQQSGERPWKQFVEALQQYIQQYDKVCIVVRSARSRNALQKLLEEYAIYGHTEYHPSQKGLFFLIGDIPFGVGMHWCSTLVLSEANIYSEHKRTIKERTHFQGLKDNDLIEGEYIIHKTYGIGRYEGLTELALHGIVQEYLILRYADDALVYLPVDAVGMIQRYTHSGEGEIILDTLGGTSWKNALHKAKKAIEAVAQDIVDLYAKRSMATKHRYASYSPLYREFEQAFPFEETPDQAKAIEEVLSDMDSAIPMDRLVCGDVGFGKTEVAIRAAVRAALDGRQVLFLCPTTLLSEQHFRTIKKRIAMLPLEVGLLNRFISKKQQKETLQALQEQKVDIIVGTHRLLSKDVVIPALSLLILDEEHRFGVRHKERIRLLQHTVDTLTLSATPIPRTLQLSLSGIRGLSVIETPPIERKPIASFLCTHEDAVLDEAVQRELNRKGQIFWVHNRVQSIYERHAVLQRRYPQASIAVIHGKMEEKAIEDIIRKFYYGTIDILLATIIIESGLDFPNANTIIVDNAHTFGLSQLYQLRGRVGRGEEQAYAYFTIPEGASIRDVAVQRLHSILDANYLGAGFQVAMEDLRIRGAGNIVGEAQSGHIERIGIDMYMELLAEAVRSLQNNQEGIEKNTPSVFVEDVEIISEISFSIPKAYIPDTKERLAYYRRLAKVSEECTRCTDVPYIVQNNDAVMEWFPASSQAPIIEEISAKYGAIPEEVALLSLLFMVKYYASRFGIQKVTLTQKEYILHWKDEQNVLAVETILGWMQKYTALTLVPPQSIVYPIKEESVIALQHLVYMLQELARVAQV